MLANKKGNEKAEGRGGKTESQMLIIRDEACGDRGLALKLATTELSSIPSGRACPRRNISLLKTLIEKSQKTDRAW